MDAWLTVDSIPAANKQCVITIPDSDDWIAIIRGCFLLLTMPGNFEKFGTLTPEQMADVWSISFRDFLGCDMNVPVGSIVAFAGSAVPVGWLLCDGSFVSKTAYPVLFGICGTKYGAGNSTDFVLPSLIGRVPVGRHPSQAAFDVLGEAGGAVNHTLVAGEMPAHTHPPVLGPAGNVVVWTGTGGTIAGAAGVQKNLTSLSSAGGGGPHNNLQPYLTVNYIIKF